jgi:Recombinase
LYYQASSTSRSDLALRQTTLPAPKLDLKPVVEAMRGKPYREIAEGLTSRNIPTPRGGDAWNAMSVMRAMKRLRIAGK